MAWIDRLRIHTWWKAAISDIQANAVSLRVSAGVSDRKLDRILRELRIMSAREEAAWARQAELIQSVKDGYASLVAERDHWKQAAEQAGADVAAQVQAALDADSEVDAGKVEAGNAALEELLAAPAPEPPAEEPAPEPEPEQPVEGDNGEQPSA